MRLRSRAKSELAKPEAERKSVGDYRSLSLLLQRLESWLFLEQGCERLRTEHPDVPLITIHDCIFTTSEYAELVTGVMSETMSRYGFNARFEVKSTSPAAQAVVA